MCIRDRAGDGGNDEAESKSLDQGDDDVPHSDEFAHEVHPVGLDVYKRQVMMCRAWLLLI